MSDWQPIETAPTEKPVLVYDPDEGVCSALASAWAGDEMLWFPHPSSQESDSLRPTHWMPLPDAPAAD